MQDVWWDAQRLALVGDDTIHLSNTDQPRMREVMKPVFLSLESAADRLMKVTSAALKLSILLGGACVIHSIRISGTSPI
ncbi:hypothetical protein D3C78_1370200 [compost metagenome]